MIIIESTVFTRRIQTLMSDDQYRVLQETLVRRPDMGARIKGGGGLRKLRWRLPGQGKRGGVRVIYYWVSADEQIRMLYVYRKVEQEDLTPEQLALLRQIVERWDG